MTEREAAIITAYTGILLGDFEVAHEYIEEVLERPVMTHELIDSVTADLVKRSSRKDFINIQITKD